jgi:signal transduction histidine kinase
VRIALLNLVDNAAKYAPAETEITIEASARDDRVEIAVIDQGPGIPPEHQKNIFTAYARGNPDRTIQGLGLGLAFVNKIAEMHKGKIELKNEAGQGCRFSLWLPYKEQSHE